MKRGAVLAASVVLFVTAVVEIGRGLWIPVKAELSQLLIRRAWHETRGQTNETRPWPWADTRPVARLRMPSLGADLIVLDGASGATMAFAPGHLHGTAAPGGDGTCVIAGHRDTHFAVLERVKPGHRLSLEDLMGVVHHYVVRAASVVHEEDVTELERFGSGSLVLMTCWPFEGLRSGGEMRYLVWAELDRGVTAPASSFATS